MKTCAGVWKIIVTKSRWEKYLYLTKEGNGRWIIFYLKKIHWKEYSGKGNDNSSSNSINYKIYKKYQQPRYLQLFMPAQWKWSGRKKQLQNKRISWIYPLPPVYFILLFPVVAYFWCKKNIAITQKTEIGPKNRSAFHS